jgi:phage terminase small subunit
MPALTNPRHEGFACALAKGKTADEAYVLAGYKPSRKNASRLRTNEDIAARIAEIQDKSVIKTEITLESLLREAAEIQAAAHADKQYSAATAAFTAKAKLAGLWVDRSETENVNTNYVVSGDPVDSAEDWEAEHTPTH